VVVTTPYDESILRSLRKITRAIDVYSRRLASRFRLTGPQLVCIRHLAASGPIAPSTLAAAVSLSHPTVTGILDRLERRELITRTRLKSDKRRVLVELTHEGMQLASASPTPLHQRFAKRLSTLPREEQAKIDAVLRNVVEMMEAEDIEMQPFSSAGPIDEQPGDSPRYFGPTEG
jgi:DNA-binding MarR family transcriptional regulator